MSGNVTGRSLNIDRGVSGILKFLCCLLIALHHFALHHPDVTASSMFLQMIATQGGYLGVGVYFFLSGYGLTRSWSNRPLTFGKFITRRLVRVYLPAVLISLIWIVVIFVLNTKGFHVSDRNRSLDVSSLPAALLNVLALNFHDYILWFVGVILLLYLSFFAYKKIAVRWQAVAAFVLCLAAVILLTNSAIGSFATISIPLFAVGVFVAEKSDWIGVHLVPFAAVSLAAILLAGFILRHDMLMVHAAINFAAIWLVVVLLTVFNVSLRLPKWVGEVSFDVYLTHNKVILVAEALMLSQSLVVFLVCTAAVAALSFGLRKLLKLS